MSAPVFGTKLNEAYAFEQVSLNNLLPHFNSISNFLD